MNVLLNVVFIVYTLTMSCYQDRRSEALFVERTALLKEIEVLYGQGSMDDDLLLLEQYVNLNNEFLRNSDGYADGYYLWGLVLAHARLFVIYDLKGEHASSVENMKSSIACGRRYLRGEHADKNDNHIWNDILKTIIALDGERVQWMHDARVRYLGD